MQRVLNDRYEIEETLGEGGMARVYRGTDRVLGRTVAIKVLGERFAKDRAFVRRFRREAQAAAGLNHPNIVSVFDSGGQDDQHFIVMEHVDGRTLGDVIRDEGPLEAERAAAVGAAVARALEAAHRTGIVHRDVKPGNVMVTAEGGVKVMDFGIARAATDDTLTQTGAVMGSPAYISPEQVQGGPVDARSDVYSLGCVLYAMVTGRQPFDADTPVALAYKHVNEAPTPPSELNPDVPPRLEAAIMRAMAKDPADRFQSAAELYEALTGDQTPGAEITQPIRGDTAVLPGPPPPDERAPLGRRWLPVLAGALLVALVGMVLLTLLGGGNGAGEDRRPAGRERAPRNVQPLPGYSVSDASDLLTERLAEGLGAGEVSQEAADDISERAGDAVERYLEGKLDEAVGKLDEAVAKVRDLQREGAIQSRPRAASITEALLTMRAAMVASPVTPSPEEPEKEEKDEGNGKNGKDGGNDGGKGKGKGNDN